MKDLGELDINGYLPASTLKYFLVFFLIEKFMIWMFTKEPPIEAALETHDGLAQVERSSFASTQVVVAKTLLNFQPTSS
jgi:hypothetical protein